MKEETGDGGEMKACFSSSEKVAARKEAGQQGTDQHVEGKEFHGLIPTDIIIVSEVWETRPHRLRMRVKLLCSGSRKDPNAGLDVAKSELKNSFIAVC